MGKYINLNIRILNHSFIIVLGALVSYLIREKRLIKQRYIQIKETFERFVQVDKSLSRDNEGSGIGLALIKSLVEMDDGTISVESKESEGTEFIIHIPCKLLDEVAGNKDVYLGDSNKNSTDRINIEFSDIYN